MKKFIKIIKENMNKKKIYHFVGDIIKNVMIQLIVELIL